MSLSNIVKKRLKQLVIELQSTEFKAEVGDTVRDAIHTRVQASRRAATEPQGKAKPLPKLSEKYKEDRGRLKKRGVLAGTTSPARSNLTKTGALLESLHRKIGNGGKISIEVGSDQQKKMAGLESMGRGWLYLTNLDIKEISDLIKVRVEKILK